MYDYQYDGFLPDYSFSPTYDLPKEMKVDIINYESGNLKRYRAVELVDNVKRVTYYEEER